MTWHEPDPLPNHYDEATVGKSWCQLHKSKVRSWIGLFYSKEKKPV